MFWRGTRRALLCSSRPLGKAGNWSLSAEALAHGARAARGPVSLSRTPGAGSSSWFRSSQERTLRPADPKRFPRGDRRPQNGSGAGSEPLRTGRGARNHEHARPLKGARRSVPDQHDGPIRLPETHYRRPSSHTDVGNEAEVMGDSIKGRPRLRLHVKLPARTHGSIVRAAVFQDRLSNTALSVLAQQTCLGLPQIVED
jgi:hypothetical protein